MVAVDKDVVKTETVVAAMEEMLSLDYRVQINGKGY